jgi:hypothetical protein
MLKGIKPSKPTLIVGDNEIRESVVGNRRIFTSSPGREQVVLKFDAKTDGYKVEAIRKGPAIAEVIRAVEAYVQMDITQ